MALVWTFHPMNAAFKDKRLSIVAKATKDAPMAGEKIRVADSASVTLDTRPKIEMTLGKVFPSEMPTRLPIAITTTGLTQSDMLRVWVKLAPSENDPGGKIQKALEQKKERAKYSPKDAGCGPDGKLNLELNLEELIKILREGEHSITIEVGQALSPGQKERAARVSEDYKIGKPAEAASADVPPPDPTTPATTSEVPGP